MLIIVASCVVSFVFRIHTRFSSTQSEDHNYNYTPKYHRWLTNPDSITTSLGVTEAGEMREIQRLGHHKWSVVHVQVV